MLSTRRLLASVLVISPLLVAAEAAAQPKKELTDVKIEDAPKEPVFEASLKAGLTASFTDQRKVVGQVDGLTTNFGVKLDAATLYRNGNHEWRNTIGVNESVTRTPLVPEFVKNGDSLSLESIYLYYFQPWLGVFARVKMDTQLFRGYDVRPGAVNYQIARADGTTSTTCAVDPETDTVDATCTTKRLSLTDSFAPLTLRESIGPFARPYKSEKANIEIRVGAGGIEAFADKQLVIADDPATKSTVEVKELSDTFQVGLEANLEVWGELYEKRISYRAFAGVLMPFAHSALPASFTGTDDVGGLTNIDAGLNVSFKIVEWASLDYQLKAVRIPAVLDEFQVTNTFLLTMGLGVDNKPPPPPEEKK